jgi:two-component system sensor histidine kinase PilS (NtrC family)
MSAVEASSTGTARAASSESVAGASDLAWRVLGLVNGSRLGVGLLLLGALIFVREPRIVGAASPGMAWLALLAMVGSAVIEWPLLRRRVLDVSTQTYLQFALDLGIVTVLMHASGGVSSGIGGFLIVSVGALSLLVPGERAFLLAALATLAILAEQTLAQWQGIATTAHYAPAGMLGAVIFFITAVVHLLRRRIMETEALAEQRGVDLQNLAELNQYIIQHLRESIVVVDGSGCIRLINESAIKHLGPAARQASMPLSDIAPELARQLREWRDGGSTWANLSSFASADATTTIQPHFAPLGGSPAGGVLIFLEDTSLLSERVQQSKLAALGRLSASIAHEIRNPIGAMSHAGQLLAEAPNITPEESRLTDIIRVNARRVSQIVESVLALSRREKTRPEQLQLKPWMEDFALEFVKTLELFEGSVRVVPEGAPDLVVHMDPTHLHQVVWNLCDNAVKYASEAAGAIAVELSCGRLEGSGRPYLDVADRGPGIGTERAEEIFEPFYTGQHGGTGLGLFISRELCESNGASLRYQARPGGGSIFRIVFADPQRWQIGASAA